MNTSEQINEIAAALSKAQGAMAPAVKDSHNPAFKSADKPKGTAYADLAANVEAARKPLTDNGLAVVQEAVTVQGGVAISTRIVHSSGQWMHFEALTVPLGKQDAHGVGSALTYARRYALGAVLGLVAEDDDGNAAAGKKPEPAKAEPVRPVGYDNWMADMSATADTGIQALRDAYKQSKQEFRAFASTDPKFDALKAKAEKVPHAA